MNPGSHACPAPGASSAPPRLSRRTAGWYAAALLAVVVAVYAPVFRYSYVQDDWIIVNFLASTPAGEALCRLWNPADRLFFRPLSGTYYLPLVKLFGTSAVGFHAGAMLMLAFGAGLAAAAIRIITGRPRLAAAAGLLYAAAAPIHLDTMTWMVGANELFAAATLLAALILFLRGRFAAAAAVWLVSLFFKEAGLFLPLLWLSALVPGRRLRELPRLLVTRLGPFALAALIFALPKLAARSMATLPDTHPYALRILGPHVFANLACYGKWSFETLFPFLIENPTKERLVAWALKHATGVGVAVAFSAAAMTLGLARRSRARVPQTTLPPPVFLTLWLGFGLLPTIFFPHHCYRYYLTYSLPPMLALFLLAARAAAGVFARRPRMRSAAAVLWVILGVGASLLFYHRRAAEGLDQRFRDGTNHLFKRGALTRMLQEEMRRLRPSLPRGCVLVFDRFDLAPVRGEALLRAGYGDPTLRAFELRRLGADEHGLYAQLPAADAYGAPLPGAPDRRIPLSRESVQAFRMERDGLTEVRGQNNLQARTK